MDTFLIITSNDLVSKSKRTWGDGSWIASEEREALEWFMFARIMGWKSKIISNNEIYIDNDSKDLVKWVIIACDPEQLSGQTENWLFQIMESTSTLVVVRSGNLNAHWFDRLGINFSAKTFHGKNIKRIDNKNKEIQIKPLISELYSKEVGTAFNLIPLLALNTCVIAGKTQFKKSNIILLGFDPIRAMDDHPQFSVIIKEILIEHAPFTVAWLDWKNTMVLRMDDPGSSELVHHNIYGDCKKLNSSQWMDLGSMLQKHRAKLSVGYVNGWVDDGNNSRGQLRINGELIDRAAGVIYPSQKIIYKSKINGLCDYQAEYEAIKNLRIKNLVQVETHGYTHITPNVKDWIDASSKHDDKKWYREFGKAASDFIANRPVIHHPLFKAKKALSEYWSDKPMVLIYPGEEFTLTAQMDALDFGWNMISSYYQAIRYEDRFCWTQQICSPYLNEIDVKWIDSEIPFIGYFHDFDLSRKGMDWFSDCVNKWKKLGISKIIDLRTLLIGLNYILSIDEKSGKTVLRIDNELGSQSLCSYEIKIKFADVDLVKHMHIGAGARSYELH